MNQKMHKHIRATLEGILMTISVCGGASIITNAATWRYFRDNPPAVHFTYKQVAEGWKRHGYNSIPRAIGTITNYPGYYCATYKRPTVSSDQFEKWLKENKIGLGGYDKFPWE